MTDRQLRHPPLAIIFDLDGVLTDTAAAHAAGWRRLAEMHGFPVDEMLLNSLRGRSRVDSLTALLGDIVVPADSFIALLDEKNGYYRDAITSLSPADLLDGARETVLSARQLGALTAVGSASKNAAFVLERLALTELFDTVVGGNDVMHAKPDPDVFLTAARRLNVAPERCAVIEDAASGIAAANAANMLAIGLGDHVDPAACALHITALPELDLTDVITRLEHR